VQLTLRADHVVRPDDRIVRHAFSSEFELMQPCRNRSSTGDAAGASGCPGNAEAAPEPIADWRAPAASSRATAWPERLGTPASLRERARSPVRGSPDATVSELDE
jgi:hypothetical protein